MSAVKLAITIDGEEVFSTDGTNWFMCGENDKETVLSALSESMVMICGGLAKPEQNAEISYRRKQPTVIKLVPRNE